MKLKKITSIGDLVIDIITHVDLPILPNNHQETDRMIIELGGACNFIIMSLRLGMHVNVIGTVGNDLYGKEIKEKLNNEGANTSGIITYKNSKTSIVYDLIDKSTKEHVFIGNYASGKSLYLSNKIKKIICNSDLIYIQGYNLIESQLKHIIFDLLDEIKLQNKLIFCDSGPIIKNVPKNIIQKFISNCDILSLTEEEVSYISKNKDINESLKYIFELGVSLIIVKKGAKGCEFITKNKKIIEPGLKVEVVDTIGAGDCFNAGAIYGILNDYEIENCAKIANLCGSTAASKLGSGSNVPLKEELMQNVKKYKKKLF